MKSTFYQGGNSIYVRLKINSLSNMLAYMMKSLFSLTFLIMFSGIGVWCHLDTYLSFKTPFKRESF